nr:hypothetical protein [Streptomyces taklimakanensis]
MLALEWYEERMLGASAGDDEAAPARHAARERHLRAVPDLPEAAPSGPVRRDGATGDRDAARRAA